jgi:hypothetical protein
LDNADNKSSAQQGLRASVAEASTIGGFTNPDSGSNWQPVFNFAFYFQEDNFNQQRL